MYALTRSHSWRKLLLAQAIPFLAALLIAETYYKFHSFVLECVAFLATWYAVDWLRVKLFGR